MKRGEIWTVVGGADYAGKPRPVVIILDDRFPTASVTVVPFTSVETDEPLFRRLVEPLPTNGLSQPSRLMVDKFMAVPRSNLGTQIG